MLKELLENIRILIRVFVSIMEHSDSRKRKNLKLFKEIQDHISNRKEKTDIFVSQAFQHITGLNLSYSDIFDLLQEDEFNKILFYIQKYPRTYEYKNGKFKYTDRISSRQLDISKSVNSIIIFLLGFVLLIIIIKWILSDAWADKIMYSLYLSIIMIVWVQAIRNDDEQVDAKILIDKMIKNQYHCERTQEIECEVQ